MPSVSGRRRQRRAKIFGQRRDRVERGNNASASVSSKALAMPERDEYTTQLTELGSLPEAKSTNSQVPLASRRSTHTGRTPAKEPPGNAVSAPLTESSEVHGYDGDEGKGVCMIS